jgi:lysophospholipase L1-like esterase
MAKAPERFETIAEMEAEARPGREGEPHGDDSLMGRFDRWGLRRFSGWDAVKAVSLATFLLLIFAGGSIRAGANELKPGLGRDIVKAIGEPAGWVADQLPLADTRRDLTSWLSPDQQLSGHGFTVGAANPSRASRLPAGVPTTPQPLERLLVTGDSLSTPLDIEIARKLADQGASVQVTRDPHLATGISNTGLVDWGKLSSTQAANDDPDAVVLFIGANEGYPMPGPSGTQVSCCGPAWEAIFRSRVGQVMDDYLNGGVERIYWLTIPTQRDPARKPIADDVNEAIRAEAASHGAAVRVIDLVPTFTPGDSYRDSIEIDGKQTIVRMPDGIHLNEDGSSLAADMVLQALDRDFEY